MIKQHETETEFTTTSAGQAADYSNPFAVMTVEQIQTQVCPYTCTCLFAGDRIAVVNVYGASSQEHACSVAASLWYPIHYRVEAGGSTHEYITPFIVVLSDLR